MAPEILANLPLDETGGGTPYSEAADCYSLSVVLWECLTRQMPYDDLVAAEDISLLDLGTVLRERVPEGLRPALSCASSIPNGDGGVASESIRNLLECGWAKAPGERANATDLMKGVDAEFNLCLEDGGLGNTGKAGSFFGLGGVEVGEEANETEGCLNNLFQLCSSRTLIFVSKRGQLYSSRIFLQYIFSSVETTVLFWLLVFIGALFTICFFSQRSLIFLYGVTGVLSVTAAGGCYMFYCSNSTETTPGHRREKTARRSK